MPGGRPRTTDMRAVVNAIFYLLRTDCQWRLLPREFAIVSPSMGRLDRRGSFEEGVLDLPLATFLLLVRV